MLKTIPLITSVFIASAAVADTTVIVPYKNTSSTHFLANLATEHLSKQVTDESFKIKNINGGSGFKAAKIFDNTAKADGKTMMITSGTIAINYILKGADKAGYEYKNWKPVFTHSTNGVAVIKPNLISLDNIMKNKPQMISTGNNIYGYDVIMALASDILGWNTKMVWGNNSGGKFKAFMSNETNLDHQTYTSYNKRYKKVVEAGDAIPIFCWGEIVDGQYTRCPDYPNLPHFLEVLEMYNIPTDSVKVRAWKLAHNAVHYLKAFMVVKKGTPDSTYNKYVAGYEKALVTDAFKIPFHKRAGTSVITIGQPAVDRFENLFNTKDTEALEWLRNFTANYNK